MMTHRPRKTLRWACWAVLIAAAPGMGQGLLTRVKVAPSDSTAGTGAIYTVSFSTSLTGAGIPADGKIRLRFPASFVDSTATAPFNVYGLNGGYLPVQNTNHVLTLTRDNSAGSTALAAGDSAQIKLAIVYNPTMAATFSLTIETLSATNALIDSATSPVFRIIHGPLHHFSINNITTPPTAGVNFNLVMSARDVYENVVTSFAGTVSFSANQSTIIPASSNSFVQGALTQAVRTNLAGAGRIITASVAGGQAGSSNAFTVNPGQLQRVKVVEGSTGNFPELAAKSLNTDQPLPVHAAGYDAFDNYITDQNVDWLIAPISATIGTFAPAGNAASTIFSANTAGTGRIVANHASPTVIDDSSGVITVTPGAPQRVTVLSGTSGNTAEIGTLNLATGQFQDMHAASFDADGNYVQDVSVNWTVTGNIGSLSQNNGVFTRFTAATVGTGVVNADHASLIDDATGTIAVISGTLARVRIVEGESGNGQPFTGRNVTTDGGLTLHAAGYDASNNYLADFTVTWAVRNGVGAVSPVISASTVFDASVPGSGRIVANHVSAQDDSTNLFTVSVGSPMRVKVLTGTSGNTAEVGALNLTTGQFQDMHASSFDADGNYIQDVSVSWTQSGNIGSLSQSSGISTRFTAATAGTGQVTADHTTLIDDATGTITVSSGTLARVRIVEGTSGAGPRFTGRNLTTDDQLTLHAAGYDASNNYLSDVTVTWVVRNGVGVVSPAINASTVFDPQVPGTAGRIVAIHASAQDDSTNLFTVAVGAPMRVKVLTGVSGNGNEVQNVNLVTGDPLDVHASSFDRDNNRIGDVSVTWTLSAPIGTMNPSFGVSTRFTATTAGSGVITADHASLEDDATGTITVQSGNLSFVKVVLGPSGPGSELGNLPRTTDGDVTVHAAGYDAQNNYLGDQVVDWSLTGATIGAFNPLNGPSTTLTLTRPGTARIVANHASARDDSSGTITVSVGTLHHIKILAGNAGGSQLEVEDLSLTADETYAVHAAGYDADNNYIDDYVVDWSITGAPIGVLTPLNGKSTTFSANKLGVGQIRAVHATAGNDVTGSITVTPGALASIKVIEGQSGFGSPLGTKTIRTDQELILHAGGFDADDNYIRDESVTWSSAGTLAPVVNATGTGVSFQPTVAPATGTIRATHASAGFDDTGTITVNVGPLHHVAVLSGSVGNTSPQNAVTLFAGNTLPVHAGGFDARNNYISDEVVDWTVDGNIGNLSANNGISTTFSAVRTGVGSIRANHPNVSVLDANGGTITVATGAVARIELRTAPNNGGATFGALTMNTDQDTTIYAAGYDAGNNYLGDFSVTWSSTGSLAPAANNATGSSFIFSPTAGAANNSVNGTIVGTYQGGISDATGTITVLPGAPNGTVALTATPNGLPADGASLATIVSSVIRDAEGNNVGPNRRFSVAVQPPTHGEITDADVDPVTPGKQIQTNASSQLSFTFRAGTTGGVATVNVNSGLAANGSVNISLGSLNIVQVSAAPSMVTRGQTGVSVTMTVQNLGTSPIQGLAGGLTFTGTQDRTTDYTVTPVAGNPTSVAGNSSVNLSFNVAVSNNAALENIQIDGNVNGTVNGTPVSKSGANLRDNWQVLRPAQLAIQTVSTSFDTVARGQTNLAVTVRVANNLGLQNSATAVIDSLRLRFFQGAANKSSEYVVTPNGSNPTNISGSSTADFSFVVNVAVGATLGDIVIDAEVYGRDANSGAPTVDLNAGTTDDWTVISGNPFRIVAITPSQPAVTAGMSREWNVKMQLQNLTSTNVSLNLAPGKTSIKFIIGSDVTSSYTIIPPGQLDNGGTVLQGNTTGTLTFRITQTGNASGIATISGVVEGTDAAGLKVTDDTNDSGAGVVTVQTPGTLEMREPLLVSQPTVTAGQSADWTITARVTNGGQSTIRVLKDSTRVSVGNNLNYFYNPLPQNFADGDSLIEAGETKALIITVRQTGNQTGNQSITVRLKGRELNSTNFVASIGGNGSVLVQSPANLVIQQVRASQFKVTAGQTNAWFITLAVNNSGESQVSVKVDTSTNVRFRIGTQIQSGYTASLSPARWLGTSTLNLAGNTTDSLRFAVTTTGSVADVVRILAKVAATETNSNEPRVATDDGTAAVTVQTQPNVAYIAGSLEPKTVNNGGQYAFKVRVRNSGGATVDLTPSLTRFIFSSGNINFTANLDQNKTRSIVPGDTTLFFVGEVVPAAMPQTTYTPAIQLRGMQNGNSYLANLSTGTNELRVTQPAQLQVTKMHSSQSTVTQEMNTDWYIWMEVANNGNSAARLDSVGLQLFNGGDVTRDFQIVKPVVFWGSNNTTLAAQGKDSLRFEILRTGPKNGPTSVQGFLRVVDLSNNQKLEARSSGNNGSFVVQSPAVLNIVSLKPSQPTITVNQTIKWSVDMEVRNTGESAVGVSFVPPATGILLSLNTGDYQVTWPTALVTGGAIIPGDTTRTLRFEVTKTGTQTGQNNITGSIRAVEVNSGVERLDNTQSGGSGAVTVQTQARLKISSTIVTSAPNKPRVNTGQSFDMLVMVENSGQEMADNVSVRLSTNGTSTISQNEKLIPGGVSSASPGSVAFNVTASSTENLNEIFTATITSATARNTGSTVPPDPHTDATETVIVQRPASLQVTNVIPSVSEVAAFSNVPWTIAVVLQNTGSASLVLDTPEVADIAITINNQTPPGFTIEAPAALSRNGSLELPGGQIDTLVYTVTSTGGRDGTATIKAEIAGKDKNNDLRLNATRNGQIIIKTTAYVKIEVTRPVVNNFFELSNVGLVNTNQNFAIEVEVNNGSLENVRNVLVELVTNGNSQIQQAQKTIDALPQNTSQTMTFNVTAAALPDNVPETFVARILAATAAQSGGAASIFRGADTTAQVRIQLPAELTLAVTSDYDNLATNQVFNLNAIVSNRPNAAEVNQSGRLTLNLPDGAGFKIEDQGPFERAFVPGQNVVWRLRAPLDPTTAPLIVNMTTVPLDLNSQAPAAVVKSADSARVNVVFSNLSINRSAIVYPDGAKDGVVSTGQTFKIECALSFSEDLSNDPERIITLDLPLNAEYTFKAGSQATISNFGELVSWEILAPPNLFVEARWFHIKAEGRPGAGELEIAQDSIRVETVPGATMSFEVKIHKEQSPDSSNTLTVNQGFKIRAILRNLGTAAAVDTANVRLQLGETGVTTTDSLEKKIYIPRGENSGIVEWVAKAPPVRTPASELTAQLINQLKDENTNSTAPWNQGNPQNVINVTVVTDSVGTLFVEQLGIDRPAGAADNTLSTRQEFSVSAKIAGRNLINLKADLIVPPGFGFDVDEDKIQEFDEWDGVDYVTWRLLAPTDRATDQSIRVEVQAEDKNSLESVQTTSPNLVIDVVTRAELLLEAAITGPASVSLDNIASIGQSFEIEARLDNRGEADTVGTGSISLALPLGYTTTEPLTKTTSNGLAVWQVTARNTPSVAAEVITLSLIPPVPKDENTDEAAQVIGIQKTLSIRTEEPSLTVTDVSAGLGIKGGPVINQQKSVQVLAFDWHNEGDEGSSNIVIKGLRFHVVDRQSAELPPNAAISRILVVAGDNPGKVFGQLAEIPNANPLTLNFTISDTVLGGGSKQATVLIDVANNATAGDFFLTVRSGDDIIAENADPPSRRVQVNLSGGTITSVASVLSSAQYEDSFFNYPNPLRGKGKTTFSYSLPQSSDVDFRIFTMLGELVYATTYKSTDPQGLPGPHKDIEWDGENGNGDPVFNGVYLAVLKTNAGTVMTKVAVVK